MSKSPKPYLDYLDKEMTIMGLLSAFSVGMAAFATERICNATSGILAEVWKTGGMHASAGVIAAVVAGFFFYLQRSYLAWYYGQIALAESRGDWNRVEESLTEADGWGVWVPYQSGFITLVLSFAFFGFAAAKALKLVPDVRIEVSLWVPSILAILVIVFRWYILTKNTFEDDPWILTIKRRDEKESR